MPAEPVSHNPEPAPLPWGETLDELADAVLADKSAPPVLLLAAFIAKRGDSTQLRSLIESALAVSA